MNGVYPVGGYSLAIGRECLARSRKWLGFGSGRLVRRSGPVSFSLLLEGRKLFRSLIPEARHALGLKAASMAGIASNDGLAVEVCRVDLMDHFHHGARSLFGFLRVTVKRLSMAVVTSHT